MTQDSELIRPRSYKQGEGAFWYVEYYLWLSVMQTSRVAHPSAHDLDVPLVRAPLVADGVFVLFSEGQHTKPWLK